MSCNHTYYARNCGSCEFQYRREEDQEERARERKRAQKERDRNNAERARERDYDRTERERHHKERLKAAEKIGQPSTASTHSEHIAQPSGGGGVDLGGVLVILCLFLVCVMYVITSTLLFALAPIVAVAAVIMVTAKYCFQKTIPGRLGQMPLAWWTVVVATGSIDFFFQSHDSGFQKPIINVSNLGLFLLTVAVMYGLLRKYRQSSSPTN